jgi:hypothetical protein
MIATKKKMKKGSKKATPNFDIDVNLDEVEPDIP